MPIDRSDDETSVVVRKLESQDIDQVVPIYREAFPGESTPDTANIWFGCNLESFPQKICFGAWRGNVLVGYIVWTEKGGFRSEAVWELEQIAVSSKYRNEGIGSKLILDSLEHVKSHTAKRGAVLKLIMVTTNVKNPAHRLYERVLGATNEAVIRELYSGDEQIMVARPGLIDTAVADPHQELLKLEYQQCHQGYNSRDQIIPRELSYVGVTLSVFSAALLFAVRFLEAYSWQFWIAYLVIALAGGLLLLGFLSDILALASSRKALRARAAEIESILAPAPQDMGLLTPLQTWRKTIPGRNKPWIERFVRLSLLRKRAVETEVDYFVIASFLTIAVWASLLIMAAVFAPEIASAG